MIVTKRWLIDNRTSKGSWTKAQADILGMEYPLKKGWMQLVINKELTDDQAKDFECAKEITSGSKLKKVIGMFLTLNVSEKETFKRWISNGKH